LTGHLAKPYKIKGKGVAFLNKKLLVSLAVVMGIGVVILCALLLWKSTDITTFDGFEQALRRQIVGVVDITEQEKEKYPDAITEYQRVLQYNEDFIFVELAVDKSVADILKDKLTQINNPLLDFAWPVHLYNKGKLIVEYSGKNERILLALKKLLGAEIPHDLYQS
jgi:hypothetical protein